MKKIIAILLIVALACINMSSAFASQQPEIKGVSYQVAVRGDLSAENAGQTVNVMLLSADADINNLEPTDIFYLKEIKTDSMGKYKLDFESKKISYSNGESNCRIYVKQGRDDVTSSLICATATGYDRYFYDLQINDGMGRKTATLSIDNPFMTNSTVKFIVASYNSEGVLISAQVEEKEISANEELFTINHSCTADTEKVKAFVWSSINLIPLTDAAEKYNTVTSEHKNVLIIGNSYSVDSTRYVHDMASSLGADIDVYLIQHGGATVYDLYTNKGDSSYFEPTQKNQSGIGRKSLDTLLDETRFDVIVMQNYWGGTNGILYYSNRNWGCSYPNAYKTMAQYLKGKQPSAEIMINSVWSNENGYNTTPEIKTAAEASVFYGVANGNHVQRLFYDNIERFNGQAAMDSAEVADENKKPLRQFPVGYAVQLAREYEGKDGNYPYFTTYDAEIMDFGNLNANDLCPIIPADEDMNRTRLNRDGYHLSFAGRYLAGLVWTEVLTGVDASKVTYVPTPESIICGYQDTTGGTSTLETIPLTFKPLTQEQISDFKMIAHKAVKKYYEYGTRGLDDPAMSLSFE